MLAKTKEWGNSLGIIIPGNIVKELNLKPGDEIYIPKIEKRANVLRELYASDVSLKGFDLKEYRKTDKFSKYD